MKYFFKNGIYPGFGMTDWAISLSLYKGKHSVSKKYEEKENKFFKFI